MADHPEAEAEAALVALGGDMPPCLALQNLWAEAVVDGGFLEEWVDDAHLSRARLSWLSMALERLRNEGFHEFLRSLPPARAETMGRFLHSFPRPWLDRAAATVAAAALDGDGVRCDDARALIAVAIAQRVRRSFVASVGRSHLSLGAAALVPLQVGVAPSGTSEATPTPLVTGRLTGPGRAVEIVVDERWLHQVWAAGAGVIDDRLVVALDTAPEGDASVRARVSASDSADGETVAAATLVDWGDDGPILRSGIVSYSGAEWHISHFT